MRTECLCISVLRLASGARVKLASCKSALTPPPRPPLPTHPSRWFVLLTVLRRMSGVSLTLFCVVVHSTGRFFKVLPCVILFFSPFSIAITLIGEERANLSAFRTFVQFALIWFCLFLLPLGLWEGLGLVIVALSGLFPYFFYTHTGCIHSF